MQDSVLIPTKVTPPRAPLTVVRRARLNRRLDAHAGSSVLISAPAGFGKTVLILDWVADAGLPCAWVSIDPFDNDPTRFFYHLAAAVAGLDVPGAERAVEQAAELIRRLGGTGGRGVLPPGLAEALGEIGRRAVVVLDDVHELESPGVLGPLEALLHAPTGGPLLVLSTRVDPPLGTPRLRLGGQLLEIRERDLRVTTDEACQLFDRLIPGGLDPSLVKQLEERTEGWVAGLRMAAIALQGADDPESVVASFAGSNRYVVEYLLEEAVERQDPAVQRFLMDTSVLRRFRVETCTAVTGDAESGARLSEVEAANLFLVPLGEGREWYRYHRLFAELLQFRLSRLHPDRVDGLHLRASEWYEREGDIHAALEHASRVSDPRRLHELLDAHALELLSRSEVATLRHWFGRLRDPLSQPYPMLLSMIGWVRVVSDRAPDLPPILEAVGRAIERVPDSYDPERKRNAALQRDVLSAFAARYEGRYVDALGTSEATLARLPAADPLMCGLLTFNMARSHMALGDADAAAPLLDRSFDDNLRAGNFYLVLAGLGQSVAVAAQREGVHRATETGETAATFAEERGLTSLPAYSTVLYNLGHVHYLSDSLDAAADAFGRAVALGRAAEFPEGHANGLVGLARVALARREMQEAESLLIDAAALAQANNVVLLDTTIELERSRLAFAREVAGETPPAPVPDARRAEAAGAPVWSTIEESRSILAMWRALRAERYERAAALAERLEEESVRLGRGVALCSAMAGAALLPDREAGRWDLVERLLELAAARGYVRPLLDGGEPVRALIHAAAVRTLSPAGRAFASDLLERFDAYGQTGGQLPATGLDGLLTEREEEVLGYLCQDMSNKAIARSMFVSAETVKTHLKHLYGKLGVNTRRQAVVRARELGLTPVHTPAPTVPHRRVASTAPTAGRSPAVSPAYPRRGGRPGAVVPARSYQARIPDYGGTCERTGDGRHRGRGESLQHRGGGRARRGLGCVARRSDGADRQRSDQPGRDRGRSV